MLPTTITSECLLVNVLHNSTRYMYRVIGLFRIDGAPDRTSGYFVIVFWINYLPVCRPAYVKACSGYRHFLIREQLFISKLLTEYREIYLAMRINTYFYIGLGHELVHI